MIKQTLSLSVLVASSLLLSPSVVHADWLIDRTGALVQIEGSILGDEISATSNTTSAERAAKEREAAKLRLEKETRARELRAPKPDNINFKVEAIRSGDAAKLRIEQDAKLDNGQVRHEKRVDLKESDSLFVEGVGEHPVEIKAVRDHELEIKRDKIKTHTDLPVSVNADNEVVLTKPNGETKVLRILPDEVKEKMIEKGLLIVESESTEQTNESDEENVELTENSDGEPVYKVKSIAQKRVLGLFRMQFAAETEVSAEDGETVSTSQETNPWRRFLERIAR